MRMRQFFVVARCCLLSAVLSAGLFLDAGLAQDPTPVITVAIRRTGRLSRRSTMLSWFRPTAFATTIRDDTARRICCNLDSRVRVLPRACFLLIPR
jgi:hypothetical protein